MAATFYTLLTKLGQAAVANATALNTPINLTKMAIGDGGGAATVPKETQTALVAQKYIANINQLTVDPANPSYIVAEMIVPTTVGGWYVREVGIFDSAGNLFAVANFPETYKPQLAEGSGRDLVIRIVIQVSNSSLVTLLVDPAVTLASQSWVIANYPNKTLLSGGQPGQVLTKSTATEQDFGWKDLPSASKTKTGIVQLDGDLTSASETKAPTVKAVNDVFLALGDGTALPFGIPIPYPLSTPPAGFITMSGQSITQAQYPKLFALYGNTLPDLRGQFIRGWDNGRGFDPSRTLLSQQLPTGLREFIGNNDVQFPGLGQIGVLNNDGPDAYDSGWAVARNSGQTTNSSGAGIKYFRPRNISFNYIVRGI